MIARHEIWMSEAIRLAERGRGRVSPNPLVGACLVRGARLVGKGCHRHFGGDHAEIVALKNAGPRARGATLYVTLEPCATWGKTPPCVAAILRAGIPEVVIGSPDSNPKNRGRGLAALRKAGVRVTSGVLASEVRRQNEAYFKYVTTGLPFVTLKMAQSLDGKIATRLGLSRWISSPASRRFVHRLRAETDAILIGKNTLLRDNPLLSPRHPSASARPGRPWRIVMDPHLEAPRNARIFRGGQITFIALSEKKLRSLGNGFHQGASTAVWLAVPERKGQLDLRELLKKLASLGVAQLLVEGGGELAWSLAARGLVDRFYWIVAPKIIGGREAKTSVEGEGVGLPSEALCPREIRVRPLGKDWLFEGRFRG